MSDFQNQMQIALPSASKIFTKGVVTIIALMVLGITLASYAKGFTENYLILNPDSVIRGCVWKLVTYAFIPGCLPSFAFNGLIILFMGSFLERQWGTKSFALLCLTTIVICAIAWTLISLVLPVTYLGVGPDACAYGIIAAFGLVFRKQKFFFWFCIIEAQYVAMILIGIGLALNIPNPMAFIWVAGAAVGYLYVKLRWRMADSGRNAESSSVPHNVSEGFVDID